MRLQKLIGWSIAAALSMGGTLAFAQGFGAGSRPGFGSPGPTNEPEKKAGPAEAVPEQEVELEPELPETPAWPEADQKRTPFFELHGYFRFRGDLQHNHNLGQYNLGRTRAPFWLPIAEQEGSNESCSLRRARRIAASGDEVTSDSDGGCSRHTLSGANIRLRLEPTLNVAETVRVHAQFDVLDNLAMGSTPDSLVTGGQSSAMPLAFLSDTQDAPVVGRNSNVAGILVKRAWAEIDTPVGQLKAGRMPWHWGLGMLANDGSCWDCNIGNNQDRVMFETRVFTHTFGFGYDFASSGPNTLGVTQSDGSTFSGNQTIDLEQLDDVNEWFVFAGRIDQPDVLAERVARGDLVVNYGAYLLWRRQEFDYALQTGSTFDNTAEVLAESLIERSAWSLTPDIWLKLMWHKFVLELEGVLVAGKIDNTSTSTDTLESRDLLQFGFVLRSRYSMFGNMLRFGMEVGMASGGEDELYDLNRSRNTLFDPDAARINDLNEFQFNRDYHVDLILFREIMGTVANAAYFKPWVQFEWLETLGARLDAIYSIAHEPIAYPGNAGNLGIELDLDLYYKNVEDGFSIGFQYGVLFPLKAMKRPAEIYGADADGASIAQTFQGRVVVQF